MHVVVGVDSVKCLRCREVCNHALKEAMDKEKSVLLAALSKSFLFSSHIASTCVIIVPKED